MARPRNPVMRPPVRNEIHCGDKLEMSFEGEITLAATLTFRVAISRATIAISARAGWWKSPISSIGFQTGCPKMTVEAEVTAIPIKQYKVIATGRPKDCPAICACWD